MTLGAPPFRDYLTEGVTRSAALDMCDQVAREAPQLAHTFLRWLVTELRASGWAGPESEST